MSTREPEDVFTGTWTEVGLVDGLLESRGITTIVKDAPNVGRNTFRTIYVFDEAEVVRAKEIVARYLRREPLVDPNTYRSWRCRACNELVEGQFEACWTCGAPKRL